MRAQTYRRVPLVAWSEHLVREALQPFVTPTGAIHLRDIAAGAGPLQALSFHFWKTRVPP